MKQQLLLLMIAAMAAGGCNDSREARLADDDTLAIGSSHDSAGGMHHGTGMDSNHGMGAMMSGNTSADMEMMNRMMVGHLGAADSMYDDRFLRMMIPHHEGAIMMADNALNNAMHPELRQLAQTIITEQEKEIAMMQQWLTKWYGSAAPAMGNDSGTTPGMMMKQMAQMNEMMVRQLGAQDSAYDKRFIDMMIPHHQGAVLMAQDAATKARHPEMKAFVGKIIADQEQEIARMTAWRTEWYGQ